MPAQLGTFELPIVASLPGSGVAGQLVFLSTDNTVYRYTGSAWIRGGGSYQTGVLYPTALRKPPTGTLGCDGSAVSRSTYATLFADIVPNVGTVTVPIGTPSSIGLVGSLGAVSAVSAATVTPAYGQSPTAKNLLVAWVAANANAVIATASAGWSIIVGDNTANGSIAIAYKNPAAGGDAAPTFTCAGATIMRAMLGEYSGCDTGAFDTAASAAAATSPLVIAGGQDSYAGGQLWIAGAFWKQTGAAAATLGRSYNNGGGGGSSTDVNDAATVGATHYDFASTLTTGNLSLDQVTFTNNQTLSGEVGVQASFRAAGLFHLTGHGFVTGDKLFLTTTGALPTGLTANTIYYVIGNDANSFWLATTLANAIAGTKIATSGTQSGVHTAWACPYGLGDGSTTFNLPDLRGQAPVGADTMFPATAQGAAAGAAGWLTGLAGKFGSQYGEQAHTLTAAESAALVYTDAGHNHTQNAHAHNESSGVNFATWSASGAYASLTSSPYPINNGGASTAGATATNQNGTASISSNAGGTAHNNVQPSQPIYWVIGT